MDPNSEINTVHTARLGNKYAHVKAYLCKDKRDGRRSYKDYIGSVYKLRDKDRSVTFQSECLIPRKDKGRPRVLLLFSNPHPGSIQKGMFHSPDPRIANLWRDLRNGGLFATEDDVLESPESLRKHCLKVVYEGPFAFAFTCYWVFPTAYPSQLKSLFGPTMEPPGLEDPEVRLNRLLKKWRPRAIISFNGKVFRALTNENIAGYTKRLRRGTVEGKYPPLGGKYRIFQTYPTGWRYRKGAPELRQASLCRIARAI
jgi:hypothetical protein